MLSLLPVVPTSAIDSQINREFDSQFGKIPVTVPLGHSQTPMDTLIEKEQRKELPRPIDHSKSFLYVYAGKGSANSRYIPSGWMGDYSAIHMSDAYMDTPSHSKTCLKLTYSGERSQGFGWAGIYWQNPGNNWGGIPGGYDLRGMHRLTFWARGATGGEKINTFKVGGIQGAYCDSDSAQIGPIELTQDWRQYTIDLTSIDLSRIIGGFAWSTGGADNKGPITFYIDQIRYER